MRTVSTVVTASLAILALAALGLGGCKKTPKAQGTSSPGAQDLGARGEERPAPRRAALKKREVPSAAAACAKGARPDRAVSQEQYELSVRVPPETQVGETAQAEITVVPKTGYKINLKYPAELTLKAGSSGLELPRGEFEKGHAKEFSAERLRFQPAFSSTSAGRKVVHGELAFSVCTPKVCIIEPDMCVAWEVTAK